MPDECSLFCGAWNYLLNRLLERIIPKRGWPLMRIHHPNSAKWRFWLCHHVAFGAIFRRRRKMDKLNFVFCSQRLCPFSGITAPSLLGWRGQVVFNHKILWQKY